MAAPSSPMALVSSSSDCRPLLEVSACGGWVGLMVHVWSLNRFRPTVKALPSASLTPFSQHTRRCGASLAIRWATRGALQPGQANRHAQEATHLHQLLAAFRTNTVLREVCGRTPAVHMRRQGSSESDRTHATLHSCLRSATQCCRHSQAQGRAGCPARILHCRHCGCPLQASASPIQVSCPTTLQPPGPQPAHRSLKDSASTT